MQKKMIYSAHPICPIYIHAHYSLLVHRTNTTTMYNIYKSNKNSEEKKTHEDNPPQPQLVMNR